MGISFFHKLRTPVGKTVTGILAFLPILTFFILLPTASYIISSNVFNNPLNDFLRDYYIFGLFFVVSISTALTLLLFLVDSQKSSYVSEEKKADWFTSLIVGNIFSIVVYYYRYILKQDTIR